MPRIKTFRNHLKKGDKCINSKYCTNKCYIEKVMTKF